MVGSDISLRSSCESLYYTVLEKETWQWREKCFKAACLCFWVVNPSMARRVCLPDLVMALVTRLLVDCNERLVVFGQFP